MTVRIHCRLATILIASGLALGCGTKRNLAVCCVSQADCNALGVDEPVLVCADGFVCVDHACVAPQCELDLDCGGEAPFCADGKCVGCRSDADCAATTPVCDDTRTCRACSLDADCESDACDFETGACMPASAVLYASPTGSVSADCSQQSPCSIAKAVSAASVGRPTVRLAAGVYTASLTLDRTVSIHGAGATLTTAETPGVLVVDAAVAHIYDLSIIRSDSMPQVTNLGVLCQSNDNVNVPKLFLVRVVVEAVIQAQGDARPMHINECRLSASQVTLKAPANVSNGYMFLAANMGTASFDRSRFIGGGGIAAAGANITITNSILDGVRGSSSEGALLAAFGWITVSYSTIFNSPLPCGTGAAPECGAAVREGVCIENSIVNKPSSLSDTIAGNLCRCDYCIVSPQQGAVVGMNNMIGASPEFTNPGEQRLPPASRQPCDRRLESFDSRHRGLRRHHPTSERAQ